MFIQNTIHEHLFKQNVREFEMVNIAGFCNSIKRKQSVGFEAFQFKCFIYLICIFSPPILSKNNNEMI